MIEIQMQCINTAEVFYFIRFFSFSIYSNNISTTYQTNCCSIIHHTSMFHSKFCDTDDLKPKNKNIFFRFSRDFYLKVNLIK